MRSLDRRRQHFIIHWLFLVFPVDEQPKNIHVCLSNYQQRTHDTCKSINLILGKVIFTVKISLAIFNFNII
ncbi:hypothetical protein PAUR_a4572 [Pseudoalteromonas aurantia 208]|uniref:Uncharacterized protein n=1 Tax=Pseudoalteromonas aurantia 208 TaxID=1314867 RepID=A0ABR9EG56_9GAMM|nr:hypothetical protein [Pseudoalteromonas aurantia 208]